MHKSGISCQYSGACLSTHEFRSWGRRLSSGLDEYENSLGSIVRSSFWKNIFLFEHSLDMDITDIFSYLPGKISSLVCVVSDAFTQLCHFSEKEATDNNKQMGRVYSNKTLFKSM